MEAQLNTYELQITSTCPVDDSPDLYSMTVTAARTIPVEEILAAVSIFKDKKIFQEDLTQELHRRINASVTLVGYHSGVKVTSTCGE